MESLSLCAASCGSLLSRPNQGVSLWACFINCSHSTSGGIRQTGWRHRSSRSNLFSSSWPAALCWSKTFEQTEAAWVRLVTSPWCHSLLLFPLSFRLICVSYSVNCDELKGKTRLILSGRDQYYESCGLQQTRMQTFVLCWDSFNVHMGGWERTRMRKRGRVNKLMCQPFASIDCCH